MAEGFPARASSDRRLVPPESCILHESWLVEIKKDLKSLKAGQEKSIERVEDLLEKHKDKTEKQIDTLWNNGINDVRTRLTKLEVKDDVEDTFKSRISRSTSDSSLKTFIQAIPKEAWILLGVALIMYGPALIAAVGAVL